MCKNMPKEIAKLSYIIGWGTTLLNNIVLNYPLVNNNSGVNSKASTS